MDLETVLKEIVAQRTEFFQSGGQFRAYTNIVHYQTVVLTPIHAVGAGHSLKQAMFYQPLVQVHYLQDRRIKTGQKLVANNKKR